MEPIARFCNSIFHKAWNALLSDHYFFYALYPESYNLVFVLLRVFPVALLAGILVYSIKNRSEKYLVKQTSNGDAILKSVVWLGVIGGILLRVYFTFTNNPVTYGNDAAARLLQAKEWYIEPNYIPGNLIWLPLYYPLVLMLVPLGFDTLMSSKIITLMLSVFTIPVFYSAAKKIFNTTTALVATLFLAINPFHVLYSSFAMSENLFLFFVVTSFFFLVKFIDKNNNKFILLSSVFINAACMIRYEGWILAGMFPLYLFSLRKDVRLSVLYFIGNTLLAIIYCLVSYTTHEILIYGVYIASADVQADLATRKNHLQHIYSRFSSELVFPVWQYILLVASIIYSAVKRYKLSYLFVWMVLFSISAFKVFTGSSQPFWRYFSFTLIMLLPYSAHFIAQLVKNNKNVLSGILLSAILLTIPSILQSYQYRKAMSEAPTDYKEACATLKKIKKPKEIIIGDVRILGEDHSSFQLDADIANSELYQPMRPWMSVFKNYEEFNDKTLIRLIENSEYNYLFIQKNLLLDSVFYSPLVQQHLLVKNIIPDTLYSSGNFQLIKIVRQ